MLGAIAEDVEVEGVGRSSLSATLLLLQRFLILRNFLNLSRIEGKVRESQIMHTRTNWEELATASHYLTATAVQTLLQQENWAEAEEGLNSLIAAMGRSEKQAVRSQLVRLMSHIIKWKCQPEKRSSSWAVTVFSARNEIADSQEEVPSINRSYLESVWEKCLARAVKLAELEMGKTSNLTSLSWEEVFEDEYYLR